MGNNGAGSSITSTTQDRTQTRAAPLPPRSGTEIRSGEGCGASPARGKTSSRVSPHRTDRQDRAKFMLPPGDHRRGSPARKLVRDRR